MSLPAISINQLNRFGLIPLNILEPISLNGNVSLLEVVVINHLVKTRSPNSIFELGTFDGRTSLNMAANMPESGVVLTLDLPQSSLNSTSFQTDPDEANFGSSLFSVGG